NLTSTKALLKARVNIDARGKAFMTPLMLAAMNGQVECMAVLRQHGADEFAVDAKGRSVLHLAVASNRPPVVRWLLNAYPPPRPQQLKQRPSIQSKATESLMTRSPKNLREASDAEGSRPIHISVEGDRAGMLE
ncbi:ankyrin repeat domain-containing protein, partial [Corynebacterium phoceense]|uniref:ankyrin repeat domain-containing protein n=1 Tax=Corynebacterium phoceense TaxID=1686286 RepID=UPI003B8A984D